MRIEECRPVSKRKTWMLVERNGTFVEPPRGFTVAYKAGSASVPSGAMPVDAMPVTPQADAPQAQA